MPSNRSCGSIFPAKAWKKMEFASDQRLPVLIVLDLDNTLWTPELYQLNQRRTPQARKDIQLFPDMPRIFRTVEQATTTGRSAPKWAVASRAQNKEWALELHSQFQVDYGNKKDTRTLLPDIFDPKHIEIQGGTKKRHFQALRECTNVPYHNMIFYDDWDVNLHEVSQLGVLCCHCPNGMTLDIFQTSLQRFHELKDGNSDQNDGCNWMGYII